MWKSLAHFVESLEKQGELARIKASVSPVLEMTEINDRIVKSEGRALLFENTGTQFPVLLNAFGSHKRLNSALGINSLEEISASFDLLFKKFSSPKKTLSDKIKLLPELLNLASYMPKSISGKGACQQVIHQNPDLSILPVLQCWPHDGGRFITLPIVHTQDPHTGTRNVGMYRIQIFEKDLASLHWHLHKNSARHFREYKALGKRMPVSVALGGDPVYTYVATAPLPDQIDEYVLAGFLRKKRVEMVKCITNDLEVPTDVDFVIEGYVDTEEDLIWEGPFGDHTGFYSLPDFYPRFHVTCITHRQNAIYPATVVGIPPQEDKFLGIATERIFLSPIKIGLLPEIVDLKLPVEGGFHNVAIAKIKKEYAGQGAKAIHSLWGMNGLMFSKFILVIDENTDIQNFASILQAIEENVDISEDLFFSKGPLDVLDHSSPQFAFGSKLGIDATVKFPDERKTAFEKQESTNIKENSLFSDIKEIGNKIIVVKKGTHSLEDAKAAFPSKKYIVFVDNELDINSLPDILWYAAGNVDPGRDIQIIDNKQVIVDACRKESGDGVRQWPNPTVMNDETISSIDEKWESLGFKEFIPSPSLHYKGLVKGNSAEVK